MRYLRTNTATIVTVGPFYDKTDGVTIETGLTITNERISFVVDLNDGSAPTLVLDNITGAASATSNDLNYITNCDAGLMQLELAAANVNYLGRAFLTITDAANHCPVFHEFTILPAMVYDSLILGTDVLQADMTQILGTAVSAPATAGILDINLKNIANAAVSTSTAQLGVNVVQISADATAADNAELFFDGTGYAGGTIKLGVDVVAISGDATAADNEEKFFDGTGYAGTNNVIPTVTTLTGHTAQTGDAYARLGAPVGASVSADVLQIKNYVDDIGAAGAGLTAIPWNAAWDAEVQSEVNDELVLQNLDHLLKTATAGVDMTTEVTDGSVISRIISNSDTSLFVPATSNLTTLGANVTAIDDYIDTEVAAILADTNELQVDWTNGGRLDLILDIIAADTTTDIPALIADVPTVAEFEARTLVAADYVVVGDTLAAVTTVGSVTGAVGSVTGAVGSVTGAVGSVTGAVGSVAANGITATSIAADAINAAAVKADAVTKIQNGLATPTNITAGTITTVTNLTNAPTNGDLTATMKASVNTEVDTALNTAVPGSPTADSINERVATMDTSVALMRLLIATGTVVDDNDPDPTATAFETDLAEASNDHYNGAFLVFTSGALLGQSRKIVGYVGATKVITTSAFTEAPAGGDTFGILGRSE